MHFVSSFLKGKRAATAIEYALIAAGIAMGIITVVFLVGDDVLGLFESIQTAFASNL
jgi:pilus assembly protein Flp/PilA